MVRMRVIARESKVREEEEEEKGRIGRLRTLRTELRVSQDLDI